MTKLGEPTRNDPQPLRSYNTLPRSEHEVSFTLGYFKQRKISYQRTTCICMLIRTLAVKRNVYIYICLTYLSIDLFIYLSIHSFIYSFIYLFYSFIYLCVCLFIHLFIYFYLIILSIYLMCVHMYLSAGNTCDKSISHEHHGISQ